MISNEVIMLVGALGITALAFFLLLILLCSRRRTCRHKEIDATLNVTRWYCDKKGRKLDKDTLLSLYTRYHEHMGESLNRHFNVRNYYTVLLSALSGLYISGIVQLEIATLNVTRWSKLDLVLLTLPVTVIVLSALAILSTTRYYSGFLRMVVLIAKIENMLGIDCQVRTEERRPEDLIWEKDKRFMIQSYWDSRKAFKDSEEFINKKKWGGDNKWAVLTFVSFSFIGIALLIGHTLVWF